MKTNSKEVREKIRKHILECVTDSEEKTYKTFEEAKKRLWDEFQRVTGDEITRRNYPNTQDRFKSYMQGIPFRFEYAYFEIKTFLNNLGINPTGKEYSPEKSETLYYNLIFREIATD